MPIPLTVSHPQLAAGWADSERSAGAVSAGSHYKALWRCESGHEWNAPVYSRSAGNGCPECIGRSVPVQRARVTVDISHPELVAEWADEDRLPSEFTRGSTFKALWRCSECAHEWRASVNSRAHATKPTGCPSCSGRVMNGTNSLRTLFPALFEELVDKEAGEMLTVSSNKKVEWECSRCGHTWLTRVADRTVGKGCIECAAKTFVSRFEQEVADFVAAHVPVETSVRRFPGITELDIFVPSVGVAIECNGVYWHSEVAKGTTAHRDKLMACRAQGIALVQVWEDDWTNRQDVVKSMLLHKLGMSRNRTVAARQTEATRITRDEAMAFFDAHHIQGFVSASHYLGLRDADGALVAAMSLKKASPGVLRLERYATSVRVPGGHSKLVSFAKRELDWDSLVTFADLEVSDGRLYETTGWVQEKTLEPDYKYVFRNRRYHKFGYRLAKFRSDPNLIFEEGLSERELAALNGLRRVWDSGKIRYRYRR